MSAGTLYDKVWDLHRVAELPGGSTQLFVGLHLIHEVTSPQAFSALKDKGLTVRCPERTVATVDHIVPTTSQERPFADPLAEDWRSGSVRLGSGCPASAADCRAGRGRRSAWPLRSCASLSNSCSCDSLSLLDS